MVQVLCIGNAIVDIIARVDDHFLEVHDCTKGAMILVEEHEAARIYSAMPPAIQRSGGSAGNTAAGIAMMGGSTGYIGKVRDDQLGRIFRHDLETLEVAFTTPSADSGPSTASSMILVTPDAQRTMNTYLGACGRLTPSDVNEDEVAQADVVYIEGYLWDRESAKEAVLKAMKIAKANGKQVAFTLSDSFCVDRFRSEFIDLVENHIDILFANEAEITSLFQVDSFEEALEKLRPHVRVAALTRSEKGCIILSKEETHQIDAAPATVVDTTGAGDLFAAGFLYGVTNGYSLADSGRLGSLAAAEVISALGARPDSDLKALLKTL
ncbi:adenosine kinase [Kordiimonas sediminis]|uniref:Adenosine kinase n=1 Tax=Kordiimonas sediminis TaxID=1735581 RepID=A0A919ALS2_9PROT|nr:adenosine kinase [Kordiimonas sediminis]GHF14893.1 adenosine kinase [Kordiimonas sediminis]